MSVDQENLRVLVVDDEVRVADSMAQILLASGYDAVPAYSAEAAMKMAEKLRPQALISDIVMGPVSGIELANHIREHYPACRVLLISGHSSTRDLTQALFARSSSLQFSPKPVPPELLLEFVAACAQAEQASRQPAEAPRPS
jgi:DNA-binding NtrC family response regulator